MAMKEYLVYSPREPKVNQAFYGFLEMHGPTVSIDELTQELTRLFGAPPPWRHEFDENEMVPGSNGTARKVEFYPISEGNIRIDDKCYWIRSDTGTTPTTERRRTRNG